MARRFDVAGYPYLDQYEAFQDDWNALAGDARAAIEKVASALGSAAGGNDVQAQLDSSEARSG